MIDKPKNPPAFPLSWPADGHGYDGMTLRDWFAGQLAGHLWMSSAEHFAKMDFSDEEAWIVVVRSAYQGADTMLAEREKSRD